MCLGALVYGKRTAFLLCFITLSRRIKELSQLRAAKDDAVEDGVGQLAGSCVREPLSFRRPPVQRL